MKACFDKNGFLLWALRGDKDVACGPGETIIDVPEDSDPNGMFMVEGALVAREETEISLPRLMLTGSDDFLVLESIPDPAWLRIDGQRRRITGGSYKISRAMRVELVGPHTSNLLTVGYQTWAEAGAAVRAERDARLTASDWTQMPDAPVDSAAWAQYRQALRDLPEQQPKVTIETVVWPIAPGQEDA